MKRPYSALREGMTYYVPVLAVGVILLGVDALVPFILWPVGLLVIVTGICMLLFFRDPQRISDASDLAVVCPADGKIVGIEDLSETPYYDGACKRVSIFLSVLDVHVNRSPVDGTVTKVIYKEGLFKNAMKAETSECNESNAVWLDSEFGPMTVRQISGAIARRIVCPVGVGDRLSRGEKFGMIKFGSRTELYLSQNARICVKIGVKVRAGTTVMAEIK